jgi:hypothetical protein
VTSEDVINQAKQKKRRRELGKSSGRANSFKSIPFLSITKLKWYHKSPIALEIMSLKILEEN